MKVRFKKIIRINPAFDKRSSDPNKNYGIHCCDLKMVLLGPRGAVQFAMSTGMYLPHVEEELDRQTRHGKEIYCHHSPMAIDLGYHSPKPMYDNEQPSNSGKICEYIGTPCFYDGSGLNAEPVMEILLREGSEGVWKFLKQYYKDTFVKCSNE